MAFFSTSGISRKSAEHRWYVVAGWIVALVVAFISTSLWLDDALTIDFESFSDQDSVVGLQLLEERMAYPDPERETVVIDSTSMTVDSVEYETLVNSVVTDLREFDELIDPESVVNYYEVVESDDPAAVEAAQGLISEDGSALIIPVTLVGELDEVTDFYEEYQDLLASHATDSTQVLSVGSMSLNETFSEISEEDLRSGEAIGILAALIILFFVFRAVVAPFIPLILAIFAIAIAIGMAAFVGSFRDLSFFITNMITLIGLAVGIDYSLFVVDRYREERRHGRSKLDAIQEAGGTASKAVLFSGLTVVFALLGLFIMPNSIFRSLGLGAILAVVVAVVAVLTLIPALLSILGDRIDWPFKRDYDDPAHISEQLKQDQETIHKGFWGRITKVVMGHPWPFVIGASALLIALAIPYFDMKKGFEGIQSMPDSDIKTAFLILDAEFAAGRLSPADIVVDGQNTPEVNDAIARLGESMTPELGFADFGETTWSPMTISLMCFRISRTIQIPKALMQRWIRCAMISFRRHSKGLTPWFTSPVTLQSTRTSSI